MITQMQRLKRVSREALTIERRRHGKGFRLIDAEGGVIVDPDLRARVRKLGIPPAWCDVRIAPLPHAHIQCCGRDEAGRIQYIYHPHWELRRLRRKQEHLSALTGALPRLRRHVREDLRAEAGSKRLAMAIGLALIDRTAMRVGRERYLDANGTRGAGTMFSRDVRVRGPVIDIAFLAKSGKTAVYRLEDAVLADAITRIKTIPGRRLLMYRSDDGTARALRTEDLNRYIKSIAGVPVTAKDFRTLHASALAGEGLARLEPGLSPTARKRQMTAVVREVAAFLQNTPTICRKSYIAPCLFALFEAGRLSQLWAAAGATRGGMRQREVRLESVLASVR